jgi:hypothetical protein
MTEQKRKEIYGPDFDSADKSFCGMQALREAI